MVHEQEIMFPYPLTLGAKGAAFAPAGAVDPKNLEKNVDILSSWGLNIDISPWCFKKCRYLAGRDQERAAHFIKSIKTQYDFLWACRGGYGSLRILPFLDECLASIHKPFWIIGFSDVSILLNYFATRFGIVTLHAPVINSICETSICSLAALKNILFEAKDIYLEGECWQKGKTEGILLGGNLVSFASLLGTKWFPDVSGKILFFEEINEDLYRLDRLITQLYHAGVFDRIAGLAMGDFPGINPQDLRELITEYFDGPIIANLPIGHRNKNFPLFIGAKTKILASEERSFLMQKFNIKT